MPPKGARSANRRGSPEAIEKRRAGRSFNDVVAVVLGSAHGQDGRTEKRRRRLLAELEEGKSQGGKELKPLDLLLRAQELLDLGETPAALRKATKKKRRPRLEGPEIIDAVKKLHRAYAFHVAVYRIIGIDDDVLAQAGLREAEPTRRKSSKP